MSDSAAKKGPSRAELARCFKALQLPGYAKEAEVRRAYRSLVLREHPDKGGDPVRFQVIQQAYDTLLRKFESEAEERKRAYESLSAKGFARPSEPKPQPKQAEEAVELRQGEDGSVLVPSSDLKRLGDEAFAAGQFERALEYYNSAAAFAKLDNLLVYAELYRMRSLSHAHLARWPEALDDAERALSLRPIWLPAAMAKAQALAALERWSAAVQAYKHAVSVPCGDFADLAQDAREGLARAEAVILHQSSLATLSGHKGAVRCAAFLCPGSLSSNGEVGPGARSWVVTGSDDAAARVWEAPSGSCLFTLKGHCGPVVAARWCPDGTRLLATASMDGTARLWEFEEREEAPGRWASRCTHTLEGHAAPLTDLVFDRCGGVLATTSEDGTARVWDTETGLLVHALPPLHKRRVNTAAFSPNGRTLTTASDDTTARVWDLMGDVEEPGDCLHTLGWDSGCVNQVSYTPCGRLIVIATHLPEVSKQFYRLLVWSAVSGRICRWLDGHTGIIHSLTWKPFPDDDEGDILVTGSQDGTLKLWDISGEPTGPGKPLMEVDAHRGRAIPRPGYMDCLFEGSVFVAKFSPDGTKLATGCKNGRVRVFDTDEWSALEDWAGHTATVRSLDWSSDGSMLVTCSDDGQARLWAASAAASCGTHEDAAADSAGDSGTVVDELEKEIAQLQARRGAVDGEEQGATETRLLAVQADMLTLQREHRWMQEHGSQSEKAAFAQTFPHKLHELRLQKLALEKELREEEPGDGGGEGHLTERAASQGGDPHAAEAAAGEARDDIAVKRSELQRRSARLNSDQERELIEVDISILDLQEQQREVARQVLTEDSVFEKQEFRAKFQEEMRALRSRRAELLKAVRTDQKAPQRGGVGARDHRGNTHAPDLSADETMQAVQAALDNSIQRFRTTAAAGSLLQCQKEMVKLYKNRCLVVGAGTGTMGEYMKASFFTMYETTLAQLARTEAEQSTNLGVSPSVAPVLAAAQLPAFVPSKGASGAMESKTEKLSTTNLDSASEDEEDGVDAAQGPLWPGAMASFAGGPSWPTMPANVEAPLSNSSTLHAPIGPFLPETPAEEFIGPQFPPAHVAASTPSADISPCPATAPTRLALHNLGIGQVRPKPVYQTPWMDPAQEMTSRRIQLEHLRAALDKEGGSAQQRELLEVELEMLDWQERRTSMVEAGTPSEKIKFNKEYAARMASLRERKNNLTVFGGEEPTEEAAARRALGDL